MSSLAGMFPELTKEVVQRASLRKGARSTEVTGLGLPWRLTGVVSHLGWNLRCRVRTLATLGAQDPGALPEGKLTSLPSKKPEQTLARTLLSLFLDVQC